MLKGQQREQCVKGKHDMTPENVWIRPSDGHRYCRACKTESRKTTRLIKAVEAEDQSERRLLNAETGEPISWTDWVAWITAQSGKG